MTKREDGKETRNRLLKAACRLFSEKGYQKTTVGEICKQACANRASINYYFDGKSNLYSECWQYAVEQFGRPVSPDRKNESPEKQLETYIRDLLGDCFEPDEKGYFTRLYMMELSNPTGLIREAWYDLVQPRRSQLQEIIRRIMGRDPDRETLAFCELSIAIQCRIPLSINPRDLEYFVTHPLDQDLVNRMAAHITRFSLAGIRAAG